ncbi:testis-expressed protein 2 isoform X1 [Onthophagus taurus]|uniref:testis-expressed protein 2 isoform X1 n=1 Tax=Onthophagus taurus TaxID=166361 RepID=UPI0039BDF09E
MRMMDKKGGKIGLGKLKGKTINTSVSSMSIRFNATSEEIDELFDCEEDNEPQTEVLIEKEKISEVEGSPRRSILPFGKRSTSVDVQQDASPPSDPWRFLSDIRGKITKSVEVKFTEYKSKNQEEGSPKTGKTKDSKENSSLSDSEEVSESSISRTCGFVSTMEGVEMSSDDDDDNTRSLSEEQDKLEKDSSQKNQNQTKSTGIKQRYKVINSNTLKEKEGVVNLEFVEAIQKITEEDEEVESGIDVLADLNVSNFNLDKEENVLNINQITGDEIRAEIVNEKNVYKCNTVFSPIGFVDLRPKPVDFTWKDYLKQYQSVLIGILTSLFYYYIPLSSYLSGFIMGVLIAFAVAFIYFKLNEETKNLTTNRENVQIVKVPAIREYQPLKKYNGWMNEFPDEYDPQTYHVMDTQSVYLRLQGNFLRISNTKHKIPKRAMWNENEHKATFSAHRIYNLLDAKINLLPDGITKIRYWSKKYPICITLNKDQLCVKIKDVGEESLEKKNVEVNGKSVKYEKLLSDEGDSKKINTTDDMDEFTDVEESDDEDNKLDNDEDEKETNLDWNGMNLDTKQTRIYLFGRTDREKEDWYRRLIAATHPNSEESNLSSPLEEEYATYMKSHKEKVELSNDYNDLWINSLITRVMFDAIREESVILKMKERIQRKLASIKLPYFIQELNCEELNLGTTSPIIKGTKTSPELNDRGLWLDLDINYEGLIVVILQTKVNLLKLKQPQQQNVEGIERVEGKSAIFHSDVDDSAESSTDEDSSKTNATSVSDQVKPAAGNRSKKIMKMVDRITESKIFQVASENRYIKKAMQDISNTDLRLKVEFKRCIGTLVLNIPPPPSDRIWFGFRTPPDLLISACPIVGERNISFLRVTSWIEKIIYKEFQKIFVIPNMEDLPIPVMSPKLPE